MGKYYAYSETATLCTIPIHLNRFPIMSLWEEIFEGTQRDHEFLL